MRCSYGRLKENKKQSIIIIWRLRAWGYVLIIFETTMNNLMIRYWTSSSYGLWSRCIFMLFHSTRSNVLKFQWPAEIPTKALVVTVIRSNSYTNTAHVKVYLKGTTFSLNFSLLRTTLICFFIQFSMNYYGISIIVWRSQSNGTKYKRQLDLCIKTILGRRMQFLLYTKENKID